MKKRVLKILTEMIPVILGILVALFINNWKEDHDNKRFLGRVLSSIEGELKENLDDLTEVIPKQEALLDTIALYLEDETISIADILVKTQGVQIPTIKNTSWQSFLNSKIELVNFKTISILSGLEEEKRFMNQKVVNLMDFLFEVPESTAVKDKGKCSYLILNLIDSEQGLVESHEEFLSTTH